MGRIPARFPVNESGLNLSRRASVATCERFNLESSLLSVSDNDGAGAGEDVLAAKTPPPVPDAAAVLNAEETGFSYGAVRKAPCSGVTLKSGGSENRSPVRETGKSGAGRAHLN